ncbi:hypothetical protein C7999DRAFT_15145 [Corynascus novoguineensis]|uniref:Uncharacterized protein n=1 Tax=Corynascus novoguineensis TaxID=1126955 RepID=A0AAN7HEN8_9PEZI|nr:hypothetical protein C7999DRAFT_15145 [Corynascus novoguineensis]
MAFRAATALAAILLAVYSIFFRDLIDAAWLVSFLAAKHSDLLVRFLGPVSLRRMLEGALGMSILTLLFCQLLRLTGERGEASRWTGHGKVLLYPCRLSHSRLLPKKHSFSYSYLLVGVPVGFEGDAGGVISVKARSRLGFFSRLPMSPPEGWFNIDASDYLERGKPGLSLRGKLDEYLRCQGVRPETYPYAYLVTAARFLGYHFNPVSFWYLYNNDKRLTAMILEVNNTFDERHMYFLVENSLLTRQSVSTSCDGNVDQSKRSCQNEPHQQHSFQQTWAKDFYVSPFNSREGSYTVTASNPLNTRCIEDTAGPINITITLLSSRGYHKMVAILSPAGNPLDPCAMTTAQKICFLARWWHVGFLTYPRILKQAAALFFLHRLRMWPRPEPLKGTLSRRATATERQLEAVFRRYLRHLVEQQSSSSSSSSAAAAATVRVKYTAAAGLLSSDDDVQVFASPAARGKKGAEKRGVDLAAPVSHELEFMVLSPVFYTRFTRYPRNGLDAFLHEFDEARTIWLSRPKLLRCLLTSKERKSSSSFSVVVSGNKSAVFWERLFFKAISHLRPGKVVGASDMDRYVMEYESETERKRYLRCVLRVMIADRIAFGSVGMLEVLGVAVPICLAWWLSKAVLSGA